MKREYEEAFAEVDEILQLMPIELLIKIPLQFKKIISENKAHYYKPKLKEPIEEEKLKYETKAILGLIYRDFLADPEERDELQKKDAEKLEKIERELQEQYDIQNVFEKRKKGKIIENMGNDAQYTTELTLYKEPNFWKKIFSRIKRLFSKNKI